MYHACCWNCGLFRFSFFFSSNGTLAGYNLYCWNADGFFRNNFYIYLRIFKLWDLCCCCLCCWSFVNIQSPILHFLPWIQLSFFWPIKKDSFIKWHFKQVIDHFIFIMHMAKQIHLWWRNCSPKQKICVYDYIFLCSDLLFPPTWMCF